MKIRSLIIAAVMTATPALALAQSAPGGMPDMKMGQGPADQGYMQAMQTMQQAMQSMQPTGDADKDFVMMMLPHHQAAVEMAQVELQNGKDAKLRKMARQIIKSQNKEIIEMKAWQAKNGQ